MSIATNFFKDPTDDMQEFAAGSTVIEQGDSGDYLYGVHMGELEVTFNGQVVNRIGPGGIVGEMALVDNQPRSAKVVATTDCQLIPFDRHRFMFFVQEHPTFALFVMQEMADRIRKLLEIE